MQRFIPVLACVLIVAWASTTPRRVQVYHDSLTLWLRTTQQVPYKPRPWINLADASNAAGNYTDAIKALTIARTVLPDAPLGSERKAQWTYLVNMELGSFAQKGGYPEIAASYFADAVRAEPWRVTQVSAR